jgi:aminopeptidase N
MAKAAPQPIYRSDYQAPDYQIEHIYLDVDLHEENTRINARLRVTRQGDHTRPLVLNGEKLRLISVAVNGEPRTPGQFSVEPRHLILPDVPEAFELETEVEVDPRTNTELEGLYLSGGNFCSQCEAEGFRKITYFPDRPDVMARYTVRISADMRRFPVLLSNGNRIEAGPLPDGRHFAVWDDPFPKPCYLFALVAGTLIDVRDGFTTKSGRKVDLHIYVQPGNERKCDHAMRSLKASMAWDEQVYGLEYDLDLFNIVAVDDFNFGAMENKSLNIFNTKYVLADPQTATDTDYAGVESVIAHEYFHNWTGNRVTCRDWFQLSLKEGLTVFRDQEFSADLGNRAVKRIADVRRLRASQYPEDAGPLAHPIRPDSYIEINNFYTATVYEKGAEVVRMYHTLLGAKGYRRGVDLYFQRHDGQAVTCDDFRLAMADANSADLSQFERWYSQPGTPEVTAEAQFDAATQRYVLTLRQSPRLPQHIPLAMGLLGADGHDLPLRLHGEAAGTATTRILELRESEQSFVFEGVSERPVLSLPRGFSAPIRLRMDVSDLELAFLLAHDSDGFTRWEAGQTLATRVMLRLVDQHLGGRPFAAPQVLIDAVAALLDDARVEPAFVAQVLTLPTEGYLAEQCTVVDPAAIHTVRQQVRSAIGSALYERFAGIHTALVNTAPYAYEPAQVGRRALRNAALSYMAATGTADALRLLERCFATANNMTDSLAALTLLADSPGEPGEKALRQFHDHWRGEPLVMGKWFAIQAMADRPDTFERVQELTRHPAFDRRNPNKVYALIGAFALNNPAQFHRPDGSGYRFLVDQALAIDTLNPSVAAHLLESLSRWRRMEAGRKGRMRAQLERVLATEGLSPDCYEIASKSLG